MTFSLNFLNIMSSRARLIISSACWLYKIYLVYIKYFSRESYVGVTFSLGTLQNYSKQSCRYLIKDLKCSFGAWGKDDLHFIAHVFLLYSSEYTKSNKFTIIPIYPLVNTIAKTMNHQLLPPLNLCNASFSRIYLSISICGLV